MDENRPRPEYNNAALRLVTGNVTNYTAGLAFSTAFATGRATDRHGGGRKCRFHHSDHGANAETPSTR